MESTPLPARRMFRRRPFGYASSEVDAYIDQAVRCYEAARSEVERLQVAEPLARVGPDVAALITSFADTVGSLRETAQREADHIRGEADAYAQTRRSEADRFVTESRDRARAASAELLNLAHSEIAVIAEQRRVVEHGLEEAAAGVQAALQALGNLARLSSASADDLLANAPSEPLGDRAPDGTPRSFIDGSPPRRDATEGLRTMDAVRAGPLPGTGGDADRVGAQAQVADGSGPRPIVTVTP